MMTKRTVKASAATRKRDLASALRSAEAASSWAELTEWLRHSELLLDLWRFDAKRAYFGSRPEPLAMRGREMARTLVRYADELDQTAREPRRQALETAIGELRVHMTRAFSGRATHLSDNSYLRSALISTIETVARLGRNEWKRTLPEDDSRWPLLADEVVRIYTEALDPARKERLKEARPQIAKA